MRTALAAVVFIGLSFAAGAIGSLATIPAIPTWYDGLIKPSWTPPSWVLGPVWNALYLVMGIAATLVAVRGSMGRFPALWLFVAHLVVNALWSVAFFWLRDLWLAVALIFVLLAAIVALIVLFARHSRLAAWLLVPYLVWVAYATTLTIGIAVLN